MTHVRMLSMTSELTQILTVSMEFLQEKLQETYEATDKYKNKCLEMTRDIKLITTALEDLVKNLNCDISSMEKKLGFEGLTCREKLQYFSKYCVIDYYHICYFIKWEMILKVLPHYLFNIFIVWYCSVPLL